MSQSTRDPAERAVAVVGLGAILPGAPDVQTFWRNVVEARDCVSEVQPDRWDQRDYYDPDPRAPGKTYSKIGGWVRGIAFDPMKYRIPPRVSAAMDEGQKWAVLCASEALRDAGHPDRPVDLNSTGVILGAAMGGELHYQTVLRLSTPEFVNAVRDTDAFRSLPAERQREMIAQINESVAGRLPATTEDTMPGELTNIMAGRVASTLNLHGPNFTTDAACASSLAALQAAVDGLCDHAYDVVLTGGIDRNMGVTSFIKFCKIGALSADGSRPYAKGANGFVMGEGGAVFVLKRLEDAERAGDRIYAVIRAIGGSSDGKGKGITAPNPIGQKYAIRRAWARAGLDPATMTLLEGHGTSTAVGDVAEIESALVAFEGKGRPPRSVALGSIKSQIGHLKAGAGAAGLLKAVLALHHKILPPSINFHEPNPAIPWDKTPFFVNTKAQPWERPSFAPRRCGLSAFGFGGTNFHVVIEEHVPGLIKKRSAVAVPGSVGETSSLRIDGSSARRPDSFSNVLAVGGADAATVRASLERALAEARAGNLPGRRPPGNDVLGADARLVIGFESQADLMKKGEDALAALEQDQPRKWRLLQTRAVHFRRGAPKKVAFLFPGQGSQYVNMLKDLDDPTVRETFAEADEVMTPILGRPLTSYVYKDDGDKEAMAAAEEALKDTTICQPAVLTTDVALLRLLARHGIEPDMLMGHSLGEWAAVVASGMLDLKNALLAVSARARGMASVTIDDKGKMASVLGPLDEIVRRLPEIGGYVVPANMNSRKQTVISGASDAVDRAVKFFNGLGMTAQIIPVSHAFHSRIVAEGAEALHTVVGDMPIVAPRIPIVGNVDGNFYPSDVGAICEKLSQQLASPVQFVKGLETLYDAGARIFLEVGPKRVLQGFAENVLEGREEVFVFSTNHPKKGGPASFHEALCGLWASGLPRSEPARSAPLELHSRAEAAAPVASAAPPPAIVAAGPAASPDYDALGRLFARFLDEGRALYQGSRPAVSPAPAAPAVMERAGRAGSVVISGAGLGLPGQGRKVFDDANIDGILRGDSFIDPIPERIRERIVGKNVTRLHKREVGEPSLDRIQSVDDVIRLAARKGSFDLAEEFGMPRDRVEAYDITTSLAVGAGLEALRDAGIPLVRHYRRTTTGSLLPGAWRLPASMADETGVIFASAFPGYDNLVDDLERYWSARAGQGSYELDRRFLFRVLAFGHAQIAELLGLRGPNTQVNSACASTTLAVGMAEDWIRAGRCRRVLIVGADDVTSDRLLEWIGAGFLATGAATTEGRLENAALPFDRRRNGMLLGMGACALVLESEDSVRERGMRGICEILGSEFANSAFHGTRLDVSHIEGVMERLVRDVERRHGVDRHAMARETVFVSHETYTPARGGSASAEVFALRRAFGEHANDMVVCNTKGFTGHPMGVGIEDAVAVKVLEKQVVPPVPNFREPDPELGVLNLSRGGHHPVRYALRLAAGFGSQIALVLLRRIPGAERRIADATVYQRWLADAAGYPEASLEVEKRTLRVKDQGPPPRQPASSTWRFGSGPMATAAVDAAPPPPSPVISAQSVAPVAPEAPREETPVAPASPRGGVMDRVLHLVGEKTGYPRDMLDPDLDLEADLGIDTVKQAEVFAMVREAFDIPRQDDLKLRDYPTLRHVVGFVEKHRPDLAMQAAPSMGAAAMPAAPSPVAAAMPGNNGVAGKVLGLVAEKTGYPQDMLELDLDLEADLGIDTVKQAEVFAMVREAFDIPRQDDLKLRDYPTLRHVIGFVEKHRPDLAMPAVAPVAMPAAAPAIAPASASRPAGDEVSQKVLELVAEKTGYPQDMLELDLDLEADLGIDTVKQAEVFAMVREAFGIPRQDDLKLRDYPTLRDVIGFVVKHRPGSEPARPAVESNSGGAPADAEISRPSATPVDPFTVGILRRPLLALRPQMDACKRTRVRLESGARVVVVADRGGTGKLLGEELGRRGAEVLLVEDRLGREAIEDRLREFQAGGPATGLYFLPGLDPHAPLPDMDHAAFQRLRSESVEALHGAARGVYDALGTEGSFFVTATRMGGHHGYGADGAGSPLGGALVGLTKALAREKPTALTKAVDFAEDAPAESIARALIEETERDPGAVEIGVLSNRRLAVALEMLDPNAPGEVPPLDLGPDSVFVVTGGAGAITVAIVKDLAAACKGTFFLLDTRPMPAQSDRARILRAVTDREGLKREIFERIKAEKGRATPAQVEEQLFDLERQAAIFQAIDAVEEVGGKAVYRQVDVLDPATVKAAVDAARDKSGRIDVILHAAGLEKSRSLDRKPVEEFDLVFRVKADGLFNLLRSTRDVEVRALVCFSSVAGRFGNAGQADYSAANDFMCKTASWWRANREGSRAIVLDWTAWGGIGMATRGSIPEIMKRAGIEMLNPNEAIPVIRHALVRGMSGEAVVGRKLGILLEPLDADGGLDPARGLLERARASSLPLPFDEARFDLHSGLEAKLRLDPRVEPFLKDHAIDGTPVLPGVMGLEAFAEISWLLAPNDRVTAIEDVRFFAPMKYYRNEPRTAVVRALPVLCADGKVRVRTSLSSVQTLVGRDPQEKLHFTAQVVIEGRRDGAGKRNGTAKRKGKGKKADKVAGGIGGEAIYQVYFHGPAYQVLAKVERTSSGQLLGTLASVLPSDTATPGSVSVVGPRLVELCFQTAGVWEIGQTGQLGLPAAVDRVIVHDVERNGGSLVAEVRAREGEGQELSFDGLVRDEDGRVYLEVQGYRTARIPGSLPEAQLAKFRGVVGV